MDYDASWQRDASSELQFYAHDDDVLAWLRAMPEVEFGVCTVFGAELVRRGESHRSFAEELFEGRIDDIPGFIAKGRSTFWLRYQRVATRPLAASGASLAQVAATTGLVLLQHGAVRHLSSDLRSKREVSRIAATTKLRHRETGQEVKMENAARVFKSLRSIIERSLTHEAIYRFPDGREERIRSCLMTDRAALAASSDPESWTARPGEKCTPA